jgi:quinol monooxygenase YgiN
LIAALIKATAKAGKRQQLLDYLSWECQVAKDTEPHVLRFDVFEDSDNENVIYYYEAYENEEGFEKHRTYPPFQRWTSGLKEELVESTEELLSGWSAALYTTATR